MQIDWKARFSRTWDSLRGDPRVQTVAIGLILFLSVTVVICLRAAQITKTDEHTAAFWLGLEGAFIEDSTFFLFVGAAALIVGFAHPEDDAVERRVKYFFNGRNVTDGAYTYIRDKMKEMGSYSPDYSYTVIYGKVDDSLNAIRANVQVERTINNMFKDGHYEGPAKYSIAGDDVGPPGTLQGELEYASLMVGDKTTFLVGEATPLVGASLQNETALKIPPDGFTKFFMKFWVWHKVGNPYQVTPQRYTEKVVLTVLNKTDRTLTLAWRGKDEHIILTPGQHHIDSYERVPAEAFEPFTLVGVAK